MTPVLVPAGGVDAVLLLRQLVVGGVFIDDVAGVSRGDHVAELVAEVQSAVSHPGRGQSVVVVRCNVPVERRRHFESVVAAVADFRIKETGFAFVSDREIDVRQIEDRDPVQPQ